MKQALQHYYREIEEKAERFVEEEEASRRDDHLRAFNLGRMVQRVEKSRHEAWLRVAWLMLGLTVGVACGRMYSDYVYPSVAHKFLTQITSVIEIAGKSGLYSCWRNLRMRV